MTKSNPLQMIRSTVALRSMVRAWRAGGARIALVPTMGALHDGHLSLVQLARTHADRVIVSIFVNPTQFGPTEDLARYPRDASGDQAKLASVDCDLIFTPDVAEIYPDGFATGIHVRGLGDILCGPFRPGHFDGVAIVVAKLLLQALPDVAIFGEKDFQQLHVIKRMVADLNIPVDILGAPILREADGLAMSSRNAYLSADQRRIAQALPRALQAAARAITDGADVAHCCATAAQTLSVAGFDSVDYVALCSEQALEPLPALTQAARLLCAARLGTTRLIDNISVCQRIQPNI